MLLGIFLWPVIRPVPHSPPYLPIIIGICRICRAYYPTPPYFPSIVVSYILGQRCNGQVDALSVRTSYFRVLFWLKRLEWPIFGRATT